MTETFTHYILQYRYQWRGGPVSWPRFTSASFESAESARAEAKRINDKRVQIGSEPYTLRIARETITTEIITEIIGDIPA